MGESSTPSRVVGDWFVDLALAYLGGLMIGAPAGLAATWFTRNELALTGQYHTLIVFGTPDEDRDRATTRPGDTGAAGVTAGLAGVHRRAQARRAHGEGDDCGRASTEETRTIRVGQIRHACRIWRAGDIHPALLLC